jgi:hypothetical protein
MRIVYAGKSKAAGRNSWTENWKGLYNQGSESKQSYGLQPNTNSNSISRISTRDEGTKGSPLSIGNIEITVSVEVSFYLE